MWSLFPGSLMLPGTSERRVVAFSRADMDPGLYLDWNGLWWRHVSSCRGGPPLACGFLGIEPYWLQETWTSAGLALERSDGTVLSLVKASSDTTCSGVKTFSTVKALSPGRSIFRPRASSLGEASGTGASSTEMVLSKLEAGEGGEACPVTLSSRVGSLGLKPSTPKLGPPLRWCQNFLWIGGLFQRQSLLWAGGFVQSGGFIQRRGFC